MKPSSNFTSLCIFICICMMLTHCVGHGIQLPQSHYEHDISVGAFKSSPSRKLRVLLEETTRPVAVKNHEDQVVSTSNSKQKGDLPGKADGKEEKGTRLGTRREWVEGKPETWQFFTMDYSQVRRRRPIHNKALPVGP